MVRGVARNRRREAVMTKDPCDVAVGTDRSLCVATARSLKVYMVETAGHSDNGAIHDMQRTEQKTIRILVVRKQSAEENGQRECEDMEETTRGPYEAWERKSDT